MKKSELLDWLQEEYRHWEALLEEIGTAHMDKPGVNGDWSIKDMVAHLYYGWQPRLIARTYQATQRGEPEPPPPWPAHLQTDDEINAWIYKSTHRRSVREVLDESQQVFQHLMAVVEGLPEDVRIELLHENKEIFISYGWAINASLLVNSFIISMMTMSQIAPGWRALRNNQRLSLKRKIWIEPTPFLRRFMLCQRFNIGMEFIHRLDQDIGVVD